MTVNQTILAIAITFTLMIVGIQTAYAQDLGALPVPEIEAPETELQLPPVYRVNRDVPCTEFAMVKAILESRNQVPIAQGRTLVPDELFAQMVLTYNSTTSEFNIIIVNDDNTVACNIYSGIGFMPIRP